MIRDEYEMILFKFWEAQRCIKTAQDQMRCERILFCWLSLGVTVWKWVTKTTPRFSDDSVCFQFDNHTWNFTSAGDLYSFSFSEIAEAGTWTPELVKKMRKHFDFAKSAGQTIEGTLEAIELFGVKSHPIPQSDENMLQQILEKEEDE